MGYKRKGKDRVLPNGRSAPKLPRFIKFPHEIIKSKKYKNLKGNSVKVLLYLCSKHTGFNNRRIACSCDELAQNLRIGKATALSCLEELTNMGFIVCVKKGYFTGRKASEWEITFLSSEGYSPTNLWKDPEQRPNRPNLRPTNLDFVQETKIEIEKNKI